MSLPKTLFASAAIITAALCLSPPGGGAALWAQGPGAGLSPEKVVSTYKVCEVLVTYFAPDGLQNIWGLDTDADDFLRSLNKNFKLVVLGAYGNPAEFLAFVEKVRSGQPAAVPRIALFSTTRKMPEKSYAGKKAENEFTRYARWFGLATNTRIIALGFEVKANGILKKKLGVDLDFEYALGSHTKVFEKYKGSLSVRLMSTVKLNGGASENSLNTTALQIKDKMVFLTLVGLDRGEQGVAALNSDLLSWRDAIAAANPAPDTGEAPAEASAEGKAGGGA